MNRKTAAIIQLVFILLIICFGTYQLYLGNFEASFSTLPFLILYYLFVTVRQKRAREQQKHENGDETEHPH
jgi:Ca2+/Na+ antiporter